MAAFRLLDWLFGRPPVPQLKNTTVDEIGCSGILESKTSKKNTVLDTFARQKQTYLPSTDLVNRILMISLCILITSYNPYIWDIWGGGGICTFILKPEPTACCSLYPPHPEMHENRPADSPGVNFPGNWQVFLMAG